MLTYPIPGCCLNVQARVGVDQGRRRCVGMCAFELITEAQSRAVDDVNGHMEYSTQHILESGLDIHGQHGISSGVLQRCPSLDRGVAHNSCLIECLLSRTRHVSRTHESSDGTH